MSFALFKEALSQEVINLINMGIDPISVYEYASHKAEGAAFFAMLSGKDYHTEISHISGFYSGLIKHEKQSVQ